jgi:tetratricopeptide (TPR) repeat protein
MPTQTPWSNLLNLLRPKLLGRREGRHVIASLRWLEAAMLERDANPGSLRNIVYRNVGTPKDKSVLRSLLIELAEEVGLEHHLPVVNEPAVFELEAHAFLGREMRTLYTRFIADPACKLLVVAPSGAGKTMLLDQLEAALPNAIRLRLEGDLVQAFEGMMTVLNLPFVSLERLLSTDPGAPFAVIASAQQEFARVVANGLKSSGRPLLLRVGTAGQIGPHALRLPSGDRVNLGGWVWTHLLHDLALEPFPIAAAFGSFEGLANPAPGFGPVSQLGPPSLNDARRFVRAKLPDLPPAKLEEIVRDADRNYDALGVLTLLAGVGGRVGSIADGPLRDFLKGVWVLCPQGETIETALLARLIDRVIDQSVAQGSTGFDFAGFQFTALERAFLESVGTQHVRPTNTNLIGDLLAPFAANEFKPLHAKAAALLNESGDASRALGHAIDANAWALLPSLAAQASHAALENAWNAIREQTDVPSETLERMARVIVEHFSTLGRYGQRILHEALEVVDQTADRGLRCWAYIKSIEALIDQAQYAQAKVTLEALRTDDVELDANTRIELALSSAAIERWTGHAERAKEFVDQAQVHAKLLPQADALQGKVQLWRGLIHKDLGDWSDALNALTSVADAETMPLPFRARTQYQIGDALMRLGQLPLAQIRLEAAASAFGQSAALVEEQTRALARHGTVLRRLGLLAASAGSFERALALNPDPFTRARTQSEAILLHAATAQFEAAFEMGVLAAGVFSESTKSRNAEATYRMARVQYRLAVAYLTRGLGRAYHQPWRGAQRDHPDLEHARGLLEATLGRLAGNATEREAALELDLRIALSLAFPDAAQAVAQAREAVRNAKHPYAACQAQLVLAEALLRAGQPATALAEINRAHATSRRAARISGHDSLHDPGLRAFSISLEAHALLPTDPEMAHDLIRSSLEDADVLAFRAGLAADFVDTLQEHDLPLPNWCSASGLESPGSPGSPESLELLRPTDRARLRHR